MQRRIQRRFFTDPPKSNNSTGNSTTSNQFTKDGSQIRHSLFQKITDNSNKFMTQPLNTLFSSNSTAPTSINLSTLCGHTAFILMLGAYLTKDMLLLRTSAITSISMSMIFQYYRPQPLLIPLRWNTIFLTINCIMATLLYLERREADNMPEEMVLVYEEGMFEERGMSRVEFHRLFGLAKKEVRERGEYLKREGERNDQLCYIANGTAVVKRRNEGGNGDGGETVLGNVEEHDFTGEIDFIQYTKMLNGTKKKGRMKEKASMNSDSSKFNDSNDIIKSDQKKNNKTLNPSHIATESIIVNSEQVTIWVWDYTELAHYLIDHPSVSNALLGYMSHELREKLEEAWEKKMQDDMEKAQVQQLAIDYLLNNIDVHDKNKYKS